VTKKTFFFFFFFYHTLTSNAHGGKRVPILDLLPRNAFENNYTVRDMTAAAASDAWCQPNCLE
jgi:hypothetical protein